MYDHQKSIQIPIEIPSEIALKTTHDESTHSGSERKFS